MTKIEGDEIVYIDHEGETRRLSRERLEEAIEDDLDRAREESLEYARGIHG